MANIVEMTTAAEFAAEVTEAKGVVLVDFWAPWCGPCKMITPVVDELAAQYEGKVKVCKVNVDEGGDLATEHDVMGVPCLIFFRDGEEIDRIIGHNPDKLKEAFAKYSA